MYGEYIAKTCGGDLLDSLADGTATNYVSAGGDVENCKRLCFANSAHNTTLSTGGAGVDVCRGFTYDAATHQCEWRTAAVTEASIMSSLASKTCYVLEGPPHVYDGAGTYINQTHESCTGLSQLAETGDGGGGADTMAPYTPLGGVDECKQLCFESGFWNTDVGVGAACFGFTWEQGKCNWWSGGAVTWSSSETTSCFRLMDKESAYVGAAAYSMVAERSCSEDANNELGELVLPDGGYSAAAGISSETTTTTEWGPPGGNRDRRLELDGHRRLAAARWGHARRLDGGVATDYRISGRDINHCKQLCFESSLHNPNFFSSDSQSCRGFAFDSSTHTCMWYKNETSRSGALSTPPKTEKSCYLIEPGVFAYTGSSPRTGEAVPFSNYTNYTCGPVTPFHETAPARGANQCKQLCFDLSAFANPNDAAQACRGFDYVEYDKCRFFLGQEVGDTEKTLRIHTEFSPSGFLSLPY